MPVTGSYNAALNAVAVLNSMRSGTAGVTGFVPASADNNNTVLPLGITIGGSNYDAVYVENIIAQGNSATQQLLVTSGISSDSIATLVPPISNTNPPATSPAVNSIQPVAGTSNNIVSTLMSGNSLMSSPLLLGAIAVGVMYFLSKD